MRSAIILAAMALVAASFAAPLRGATLTPPDITAGAPPDVELAGPRCGPHAHYVRGHRSRVTGQWIAGHCVRNRR